MVRNRDIASPANDITLSGAGILHGMRRLFLVSLFVAPFGVAFGAAAVEHGLGPVQATVMSLLVFTATAQFAALDLLGDQVAFLSLFLVTLTLSARHVVMGAALSGWINRLPVFKRAAALVLLSDANFADAHPALRDGSTDLGRFVGGGLMLWLVWGLSTAMGAFGGTHLGDTSAFGFGAIMVCFFAATMVRMLRASSGLLLPAMIAMLISVITQPILPTGWNIMLAAVAGGALAIWRPHE
ncbi:AzlC family ABC transporter permease [Thalassococcus sp. S3]|uniref:AzlC family ABC transporter permease n=1 Tax=Thalassococcus sp. S3 TaxID=2017482 RepID=UPI0010248361|nr:AzlC family ABC transporter permease [Thalassococcus sp. S3]QBF32488.1 branched-chain amino acid ABC transporter permease [Thalassococcus sp. S3]